MQDALPRLSDEGMGTFHLYAFATLRQCGMTAELAADLMTWLTERGQGALAGAADDFRAVAEAGVDLISSGALTHSVTALDIGLDIA